MAQQVFLADAVRMCQQQARLEPGIVDAGLPQPFGGKLDRLADCRVQAAGLDARLDRARSSRRFSALASGDSRPSAVFSR